MEEGSCTDESMAVTGTEVVPYDFQALAQRNQDMESISNRRKTRVHDPSIWDHQLYQMIISVNETAELARQMNQDDRSSVKRAYDQLQARSDEIIDSLDSIESNRNQRIMDLYQGFVQQAKKFSQSVYGKLAIFEANVKSRTRLVEEGQRRSEEAVEAIRIFLTELLTRQ